MIRVLLVLACFAASAHADFFSSRPPSRDAQIRAASVRTENMRPERGQTNDLAA